MPIQTVKAIGTVAISQAVAITSGAIWARGLFGLPQAAFALGNAIIATVEESNTLFPDRRITIGGVAIDHGLMNLDSTSISAIRMCHGAGGVAGHVQFGVRTGGLWSSSAFAGSS